MTISRDDEILGGEPRIDGTRVAVRHVAARVIDHGSSPARGSSLPARASTSPPSGRRCPAHVADQFDLSLSSVYAALSYYYDHLDEMRDFEQENEAAFERARESSPKPKETVQ